MDGDCFINSCFSSMHNSTAEQSNISKTNAASKKYADPKLNAVCKVILQRLPINLKKPYTYRTTKKPRVFTILSDSEEKLDSKMVNKKKTKKVPIKGTRRLFRLSDSEDEAITHKDVNRTVAQTNLPIKESKMTSEFVTEKSLNTPEGIRVIQRTTSSIDEKETIKRMTKYEQTKIEEITLSSDEEDSLPTSPVLIPFELDSPSDTESSASSTTDGNVPWISIHSNTTTPAIASDEKKELSEGTKTEEEKLRNLLASGRFKSKEKSTKPTRPRPFPSRRGKTFRQSDSTNFKKKKPVSLRHKIGENQGLTSYNTSVNLANQKNGSSIISGVNFLPVVTIGNKVHEPIPTYKPPIPQPGPVKAKSTATSRNDKLAADFMKSKILPIEEKKEPPKAALSSNYVIPRKATKIMNSVSISDSSKRKFPSEDAELLTNSASASNEISPSFKPAVNRVARVTEKGTEKQLKRQPTASATANRALNSSILNLGRSRDGSYGKKRVRSSERNKTVHIDRRPHSKIFPNNPSAYRYEKVGEHQFKLKSIDRSS